MESYSHNQLDEQKPLFLHDSHQSHHSQQHHHLNSYHHRQSLPRDLSSNSSSTMECKPPSMMDPSTHRGIDPNLLPTSRMTRSMYGEYEGGGQSGSSLPQFQSHSLSAPNSNSPSYQSSPGTSPAPAISAAAEYLKQQEIIRSQPRKRIYQDWNQIAVFNTPSEAEEGIKNFENCRWKVGNKFTSREGFKVYWSCREGAGCPVQIHLLYHSQLPRVVLYRNQPQHHHAEKVKTRGLLPEVESLIRELFANGVNKPRRIQFILQKKGMEEVPQTKLSNFLVKLRREASLPGHVPPKRTRYSYNEDYDDEDEDDGGQGSSFHDEKSNTTMSPSSAIFPSVVMASPHPPDGLVPPSYPPLSHPQPPPPPPQQLGSGSYNSPYNMGGLGGGGGGGPSLAPYPPPHGLELGGGSGYGGRKGHGLGGGGGGNLAPPPPSNSGSGLGGGGVRGSEEADQSEVVTCSSSRTRSLYFRDENTEDGEKCLPDEESIKEMLINHIKTNYSNRDMLHIRQELLTLKRDNKFTALNRLLSFTAGFLQDTFLEERTPPTPFSSPGDEGGEVNGET